MCEVRYRQYINRFWVVCARFICSTYQLDRVHWQGCGSQNSVQRGGCLPDAAMLQIACKWKVWKVEWGDRGPYHWGGVEIRGPGSHTHTDTYIYIYTHIHTYNIYIHTHVYVYVYVRIYIYIYLCICIHIQYIYIYTYRVWKWMTKYET